MTDTGRPQPAARQQRPRSMGFYPHAGPDP